MWAGLDQQQVADAMNVARTTISSWEVGRTEPSVSHFAEWAQLTGQTMEWLAGVGGALRDDVDPAADEGATQARGDFLVTGV